MDKPTDIFDRIKSSIAQKISLGCNKEYLHMYLNRRMLALLEGDNKSFPPHYTQHFLELVKYIEQSDCPEEAEELVTKTDDPPRVAFSLLDRLKLTTLLKKIRGR